MKFSEAMIKGYSHPRIQGRQCRRAYGRTKHRSPLDYTEMGAAASCCAAGAVLVGGGNLKAFELEFEAAVGVCATSLNDAGIDWRDIAGIAMAEGL